MTHGDFIKTLGGGTQVAEWLSKASRTPVDRESVYKWANNGIPWRWRPYLLQMAEQRGAKTPKNFVPGVAA